MTKAHSLQFQLLLKKNRVYVKAFKKSSFIKLFASKAIDKKQVRQQMMDALQVLSDYFQKMVMLRHVLCDDAKFLPVTLDHLQEEFGHNLSLSEERCHRPVTWDPVLDAAAAWFSWKMFTADNDEKTLLMHLVLETSANIFFHTAYPVMSRYRKTHYFAIHSEADEKHEMMGQALLKDLPRTKLERMLQVQQQGWDMLNTICNRIIQLALINTGYDEATVIHPLRRRVT